MSQVYCPSCGRKHPVAEARLGRLPSCRRCGVACLPDANADTRDVVRRNPRWVRLITGLITTFVVTVLLMVFLFLMLTAPRRRP